MEPIEIIVIVCAVLVVLSVLASYIYKRIKHIPSSDCQSCHKRMNQAIKRAQKNLKKNNDK